MHNISRKSLLGGAAFLAMVSAPVAFAQDAATTAADPAASPPAAPPAQEQPAQAQSSGRMSWADVDTDQDGNLSKEEAAAVPALAQVFDQADTNGDGLLSPEEYMAFASAQQPGAPQQGAPQQQGGQPAEAGGDGE